jgi:Polyketide cyclase / dehydrase and lipid transport
MLKYLLFGFLAVLAILLIVPAMSSGDWAAGTSVTINASPAEIYEDVASPERWLEWSVWNEKRDKECKHKFPEPKIGKGATWKWKGQDPPDGLGEGDMLITKASATEGIEYELNFVGFPKMIGKIEFTAKDGATEVKWTSSGNVGDTYMFKLMNTYGLMASAMIEEYENSLATLKERAESRAAKIGKPVEASAKKK